MPTWLLEEVMDQASLYLRCFVTLKLDSSELLREERNVIAGWSVSGTSHRPFLPCITAKTVMLQSRGSCTYFRTRTL
jgi:hypothetical protein